MRKLASNRQRLAGFTIIEVLMATVILTVGFMGLIEAMTICSGMMDEARRQTLATQILDDEIGKMRLRSWDLTKTQPDLNQTLINSTNYPKSPFLAAIAASGATYTLSLTVSYVDPTTNTVATVDTGMAEAMITVTWVVKSSRRDESGNPVTFTHSRSSSTYFGKYGLNLSDQRS